MKPYDAFEDDEYSSIDPLSVTHLDIVSLADVQSVPIDWLWPRWLARGKLHLIGGHQGDGKSTVTTAMAAEHSIGGHWPDGSRAAIGNTLFLLAEDALDDTLKPRLELHGADMTRIHAVRAVVDPGEPNRRRERMFNLSTHLQLLDTAIRQYDIDLVVIDPLSSFMPSTDRNSEDVRDILTPLSKLAERRKVAVAGTMHVTKPQAGGTRRAVQMLLGATAYTAVARIVWALAPIPDDSDPSRRALAVVKTNLSMKPRGLEFRRDEDGPIQWLGESDFDIDQLLTGATEKPASPERADILRTLDAATEPLSPTDVAKRLGKNVNTVRNMLRSMLDDATVVQPKYGIYTTLSHRCLDSIDSPTVTLQESTESMTLALTTAVDSSPSYPADRCPNCGGDDFRKNAVGEWRCYTWSCLNGSQQRSVA